MSDITGYVSEYKQLNVEIKRINTQVRKLKKRRKEVESYILKYLESTKYPGVKYQGVAFYKDLKKTKVTKKKDEKIQECANLLNQYNIPDSEQLVSQIVKTFTTKKVKNNDVIKMRGV